MKVLSLEIKNFKNIEAQDVQLNGRSAFIVGDNGVGKTSFIQALYVALTGKELPSRPIKDGESEAIITTVIGEKDRPQWEIEVKFNATNPKGKLTVRDKTGKSITSPRTVLDSLIGNVIFDPFDFIRETPAKQIKFIKDFAGINFDVLDKEKKQVTEDRLLNNRDVKNLEGKIAESNVNESDLRSFTEPKDIEEIKKEIAAVDGKNDKHQKGVKLLGEYQNTRKANTEKFESNSQEIDELRAKIKALEEANQKIITDNTEIDESIAKGEQFIKDNPLAVSTELNERYQKIIAYNNRVKEVQSVNNDMARLEDLKVISEQYSARLKEIDKEKLDIISKSKMPMRGLGFTDDYLTLNGLEFHEDQIPKSHIIQAGIEIMMAMNPNLKICRIKDGSLLGSLQYEVINMIQEGGYQFFVEIVNEDTKEVEVQIVET